MSEVWLISKMGPEWNDPIEAYTKERKAEKRAEELQQELADGNLTDRLSTIVVRPVPLIE